MPTEQISESKWRLSWCPLYWSFNFYIGLKFFKKKRLREKDEFKGVRVGSLNFWVMVPRALSLTNLVLPKEQQSFQDLKASETFKGGSVWCECALEWAGEGRAAATGQGHDYGVKYPSFHQRRGPSPVWGLSKEGLNKDIVSRAKIWDAELQPLHPKDQPLYTLPQVQQDPPLGSGQLAWLHRSPPQGSPSQVQSPLLPGCAY